MEEIKTYLKGLGLLLALIVLGIVGFVALFATELIVFILLLIIFIFVAIIAIILAPYYYAKEHKIVSKNFKLKKIKKREKL